MNTQVFQTRPGRMVPAADATNEAGGLAYTLDAKTALAKYVTVGCLNNTYYATADEQLDKLLTLARQVPPAFVAKCAVYARSKGFMKDAPAVLCALLSTTTEGRALLPATFRRVVDNGRMLRNFVQVIRSGKVGRKSLGTRPKKLVAEWLLSRDPEDLFRDSVGNTPSVADVIKLSRPKPIAADQRAMFAYLLGKEHDVSALPECVKAFEAFKKNPAGEVPGCDFRMLANLPLTAPQWAQVATRGGWHMVRMNLNTFARHGAFAEAGMPEAVAAKLRDPEAVRRAKVFPYQLMAAYKHADATVPRVVTESLQDAMEVATENVPELAGKVYVCPDVSGSMSSPVTGHRGSATTAVQCVDVAALVTAAILRKNPLAEALPFDTAVRRVPINPRDSVMTNAQKLAMNGGGTSCSEPVRLLNAERASADLVVIVSDNESWADMLGQGYRQGTGLAREWAALKARCPKARLALIDLQPSATAQVLPGDDVLFVAGFSDNVFEVLAAFASGQTDWLAHIEAVEV